jgi:CheY-like chemotaxis protein
MSPAALFDHVRAPPAILLVEDEAVLRALLAEELRFAGMTVIEAANADEAWAFLQAGGSVSLLLSDVAMPGSMDGIALMKLVRAAYPEIRVVITSGNLGPRDVSEFDGFVQKPYSFSKAVATVSSLLGWEPPAA